MPGEPTAAYLFDLDGVLRVREHEPPARLTELAYDLDRYGPALLGEITDDQWRFSVAGALIAEGLASDAAVQAVLDWSEPMGRVDREVLAVVEEIRAGGRQVALVVNATDRLERELVALGLDESFDTIVNSARTGVALPAAAMYEIAAGILAVPVPRCAYIGRRPELVAGAERIGMTGHLFDSAAALRSVVAELSAG